MDAGCIEINPLRSQICWCRLIKDALITLWIGLLHQELMRKIIVRMWKNLSWKNITIIRRILYSQFGAVIHKEKNR